MREQADRETSRVSRAGSYWARRRDVRLFLVLVDLLAIIGAFQASIHIRLALNPFFHAQLDRVMIDYLVPPLGLVLALWPVASWWGRLYRPRSGSLAASTILQVVEVMATVVVSTIVVTFFLRDFGQAFSRSFVIFLGTTGTILMLAARGAVWSVLVLLGEKALRPERVLILGGGESTAALVKRLESVGGRAISLRGVVLCGVAEPARSVGNPVPVVGSLDELGALINDHGADRVIAVEHDVSRGDLQRAIGICARMGIPLSHTVDLLERVAARMDLADIAGIPVVEVRGVEFTRFQLILKRLFDLVGAAALLVLLAPLMLVLALLIRLSSSGPALYVSWRVGKGGKHFRFFKYRTMVRDADSHREELAPANEKGGHLFKLVRDPRVTTLGRFLRGYSLDELPQLLNVLLGDMSLVGPRPLPAKDLDRDGMSTEFKIWAAERSRVCPGITGLWQVRGRSAVDFEEMQRLDLIYVRGWRLRQDLRILAETVPAVLFGRGAC